MASRLELHNRLVELFGNSHVYYQPPEGQKMDYPAIVYSIDKIDTAKADNTAYLKHRRYRITVMDKRPDNPVINKLLDLPYCYYDRYFKSENLNHDILLLYW